MSTKKNKEKKFIGDKLGIQKQVIPENFVSQKILLMCSNENSNPFLNSNPF